jgi:fatty-acyl-CoA synthase
MFHITGMVSVMHTSILLGASLVLMPRWDRDVAGHLISKRCVTHWTNIPTMVIDLLGSPHMDQYDLSSLVLHRRRRRGHAPSGGATFVGAVRAALCRRLWFDRNRRALAFQPTRCSQKAVPGHSVHERGCAHGGPRALAELPLGESGEIVISGPKVFKGIGSAPRPPPARFLSVTGSGFSAQATWAGWMRRAISSSPIA